MLTSRRTQQHLDEKFGGSKDNCIRLLNRSGAVDDEDGVVTYVARTGGDQDASFIRRGRNERIAALTSVGSGAIVRG